MYKFKWYEAQQNLLENAFLDPRTYDGWWRRGQVSRNELWWSNQYHTGNKA